MSKSHNFTSEQMNALRLINDFVKAQALENNLQAYVSVHLSGKALAVRYEGASSDKFTQAALRQHAALSEKFNCLPYMTAHNKQEGSFTYRVNSIDLA